MSGGHEYRADIDGLRAVAILGVVAYHVGIPPISGGFTGVDVFFVISGYLITQLLVREITSTGRLSLANFYARRVRRLLPALVVVILSTLLVGNFVLPPGEARQQLAASAVAASFFVANHYFLATTGGYFQGPSDLQPLLHLWSLSVEEQFYIFWPLLLIALMGFRDRRRYVRRIAIAAATISASSFLLSIWLVQVKPEAAFFIAPSRAWELGAGALVALYSSRLEAMPGILRSAIVWLGLLLIGAAFVLITPGTRFPGVAATIPVLGSVFVVAAGGGSGHSSFRFLSLRPMVTIGKLSYGWYLWHWPMLSLSHSWQLMETNRAWDIAMATLALVLAALTFKYVESPIRHGVGSGRVSTRVVLGAGAVAMVAMAGVSAVPLSRETPWPDTARNRVSAKVTADHPPTEQMNCLLDRNAWRGKLPGESCTFGDRSKAPNVVLWGDSHAMSWAPILEPYLQEGRMTYVQMTMTGCRPIAPEVVDRYSPNCVEFRRQVFEAIASMKQRGLKGIIIAGRWPPMSNADVPVFNRPRMHRGLRDYLASIVSTPAPGESPAKDALPDAIATTLQDLERMHVRVLVLLDPPELRYPPAACLYVHDSDPDRCGIEREYYARNFAGVAPTFARIAASHPNVRIVDPVAYFCDEVHCAATRADGSPLLYDADHVAASAARALAPTIKADVSWLLQD